MTYSPSSRDASRDAVPVPTLSPKHIFIVDDQSVVVTPSQDTFNHHINGVLVDTDRPQRSGLETSRDPSIFDVKTLLLTPDHQQEDIQTFISAGNNGGIFKQMPVQNSNSAINVVDVLFEVLSSQSDTSSAAPSHPTLKTTALREKPHNPPTQPPADEPETVVPALRSESTSAPAVAIKKAFSRQISAPVESGEISILPELNPDEFLPSIEKWLTWGGLSIVTILALAIPATSLLTYKTTVKTQATVRPAGELRLVQAPTEGQIADILVEKGDTVNKGEVIATIDSSRWKTRKQQLEKAIAQQKLQLLQLDSQAEALETQISAEADSNQSEIFATHAQLSGHRRRHLDRGVETSAQVSRTEAQLAAAQATLQTAQSKADKYRYLVSQGALSQLQLEEADLEVQQQQQQIAVAEAELQTAIAALNPSKSEIETTQRRIRQLDKSGQANIARLHREKDGLIRQRIEVHQQLEQDTEELKQTEKDLQSTQLTATAKGIVSALNLRNPGQSIQTGQEIAQIVPEDAPLEIKATVAPQDIAKLEIAQQVHMRVSACPYPDYGTLQGTISDIAQDISQPQNANNASGDRPAPAFFEVTITPEDSSFGRGEHICPLQLGMEGSSDIITREESVLNFILRKARIISNI